MKKQFFYGVIVLFALTITLTSCKKDKKEEAQSISEAIIGTWMLDRHAIKETRISDNTVIKDAVYYPPSNSSYFIAFNGIFTIFSGDTNNNGSLDFSDTSNYKLEGNMCFEEYNLNNGSGDSIAYDPIGTLAVRGNVLSLSYDYVDDGIKYDEVEYYNKK